MLADAVGALFSALTPAALLNVVLLGACFLAASSLGVGGWTGLVLAVAATATLDVIYALAVRAARRRRRSRRREARQSDR